MKIKQVIKSYRQTNLIITNKPRKSDRRKETMGAGGLKFVLYVLFLVYSYLHDN